ncbi:MAG: YicC family protein [Alphaproteobacteria bacterium]|nr:YicC family protein [Alphaproteobacteria bacterium]
MTGFARAEGVQGGYGWSWEVRSVNARNLDTRLRMPAGFDRLEAGLRQAVSDRFKRGSVSLSLTVARPERPPQLRVNRDVLDQVLALAGELSGRIEAAPPRIDGLLAVRGVLEAVEAEETEEERARLDEAVTAGCIDALAALSVARGEEGGRLKILIAAHLARIAELAAGAVACGESQPAAVEERLREAVSTLLETDQRLSEERLAQEVALLVAKSDVREEIDRLVAHVEAARELLDSGDAVGRRLDFLCQEFNREANTLCSKAQSLELTRVGLDLKAAVEQLREQIQNVE